MTRKPPVPTQVDEFYLDDCAWRDGECPKTVLSETGNWEEGIWATYVEACLWALISLSGEADAYTHAECVLGLGVMLVGILVSNPASPDSVVTPDASVTWEMTEAPRATGPRGGHSRDDRRDPLARRPKRPRLTECTTTYVRLQVLAFLVGDISNIMSNLDPVTNEFKQTLDNLNEYMRQKASFSTALRLKLREYIMLSEPIYRDEFNKDMLSKLSPTLQAIVAKQNWQRVVNRIPFTAYTVKCVTGHRRGSPVQVRQGPDGTSPTDDVRTATLLSASSAIGRLRYDVQYDDDASTERGVKPRGCPALTTVRATRREHVLDVHHHGTHSE